MPVLLERESLRRLIVEQIDSSLPRCRRETVVIKSIPVTLEIADTPFLRDKGLMFRESLGGNEGMLFVFPDDDRRGFWMKNTLIPLSIAFIDREGYVINIEDMNPNDLQSKYSQAPARYALEMNSGWFDRNRVSSGEFILSKTHD